MKGEKMTLEEQCKAATSCLPQGEWRSRLEALYSDMLRERVELLQQASQSKEQAQAFAADAKRYRVMLANLQSLVLRTDGGATLTLKAERRGIEFTRRGTDATLDGLGDVAHAKAVAEAAEEQG